MEAALPTTADFPTLAEYAVSGVPTDAGTDWIDRARQGVVAAVSTLVVVAGIHAANRISLPTEAEAVEAIGPSHATHVDRPELVTIARVRELGMREAGWDGGDADAANIQAVKDAERFIYKLPLKKIAAPHISLATDGEINFFWKTKKGHLDLGFYGTGNYSYFARSADGAEYVADDQPSSKPLPKEIVGLLMA